jgi:hypothetical protein
MLMLAWSLQFCVYIIAGQSLVALEWIAAMLAIQ